MKISRYDIYRCKLFHSHNLIIVDNKGQVYRDTKMEQNTIYLPEFLVYGKP